MPGRRWPVRMALLVMTYVPCDRGPGYVGNGGNRFGEIGSTISAANATALAPAVVLPAGTDEVSAAIAAPFETHAQAY